jgi:putative chitinase
MIDWRRAQRRLGVADDGDFGPVSYGALLSAVANHVVPDAIALGTALAVNDHAYHIDDNVDRLASFVGQTCHESAGYTRMNEMGGTAYFTRLYENAKRLGNTQPGDGARFHGRGLIQLTGRANYRACGRDLNLDLLARPELVASPSLAVLSSLWFWLRNGLNAYADAQDWTGMTRVINGGTNGLRERVVLIEMAKGLLA